jgi:predicted ATPase
LARNSFVGREHERAELSAALADAIGGRVRLALVSGEPGIGKSRLCAELAAEAHAKAVAVLVGHCSEQEALPYLPFVEILQGCVDRAAGAQEIHRAIGEDGPELARLLPRLRRMLPDLPPPLDLSPVQARRQLFDSVCNFIAGQGREHPVLLILEDLHWADDSTLALFSLLAERHAELPLLLIGTRRVSEADVGPPLACTLEDLVRGRLAAQIRLEGLAQDDIALMLKDLGAQEPPSAIVDEFRRETDGNPFFVEELFRHLTEENRLYDSSGRCRAGFKIEELEVPQNVRLVVGRRLKRLAVATTTLLTTAAVIGRSFTFELLEASTRMEPETLLDSVDEAVRVGVVRSSKNYAEERLEFSHELIRQVVLAQLSAGRRRRLHLEVGEAIERLYSDVIEDRYAELAHHYEQTVDNAKAVNYLYLAGRQALERSAEPEAIAFLSAGLERLKTLAESPERDRIELKIQLTIGTVAIALQGFLLPKLRTHTAGPSRYAVDWTIGRT